MPLDRGDLLPFLGAERGRHVACVPVSGWTASGLRTVVGSCPPHRAACGAGLAWQASAASGYVCPVDDAAESLVVGMVIAPDDVPADHAGLLAVAGVVGTVEGEVPQRRELRLYAV